MQAWVEQLLRALALPEVGLSTVFIISFISATLLPLGSEPAVFGLLKLSPELFWSTIFVATAGNTLGGMVDYWMGYGAKNALAKEKPVNAKALKWLEQLGPKALFFAFLPGIGDPLCAVAGWLKLPFWPSTFYMLIGKFLRYLIYTPLLLWVFPGQWHP